MTKVLIVEDEALIAMLLEEMLIDRQFSVTAHAATLGEAVAAAELDIDVAILDVSLAGEAVYPVAEKLTARNIPFVFTTGYGAIGIPEDWANRPVFTKPYDIAELATTLSQLIASKS